MNVVLIEEAHLYSLLVSSINLYLQRKWIKFYHDSNLPYVLVFVSFSNFKFARITSPYYIRGSIFSVSLASKSALANDCQIKRITIENKKQL